MKKFVFPIIVALFAAFSFSACDNEVTDDDLITNIQKYKDYTGQDQDGDAVTATFNATTFTISYVEFTLNLGGSWTVVNGKLNLTGADGWSSGIIEQDGKKLIISDNAGTTYSLTKK